MEFENENERIFHKARGLPAEARHACVLQACGTDSARAAKILQLIEAGAYMEGRNELLRDEKVGPYIVDRKLGEGGMGAVYLAEQPSLNRRVALKVVRGDRMSSVSLSRFLGEQHALAQLIHPNIATLYGAGVTKKGQPFFAMEYGGLRITAGRIGRGVR